MNKLNIPKVKKSYHKLKQELKRNPLPEEIACEIDMRVDVVKEILLHLNYSKKPMKTTPSVELLDIQGTVFDVVNDKKKKKAIDKAITSIGRSKRYSQEQYSTEFFTIISILLLQDKMNEIIKTINQLKNHENTN